MVSSTSTRTQSGDVKFATNRAKSTFNDVLKEARTAFEKTNEKSYQGPMLADPQPAQQQARRDLLSVAGRLQGDGQGLYNKAQSLWGQGAQTTRQGGRMQGEGQQAIDLASQLQGSGQGARNMAEQLRGQGQNAINDAAQVGNVGEQLLRQGQQLSGSGQPIIDLAQDTARGEYLDVRNRPEFQANIEAAIDPAREQLTQEILPQAQSQAIQAGAYGGDRDLLNRRVVLEDFSEQASQTASQIAARAYENERGRQQQAGQLLQSGLAAEQAAGGISAQGANLQSQEAQLRQAGIDTERSVSDLMRRGIATEQDVAQLRQRGVNTEAKISDLIRSGAATMNDFQNIMGSAAQLQQLGPRLAAQVGARQRADQQAQYDEQLRRFQMEQQAPWIGLPQYAQIATGTPTTSTSTVQRTPSESQQIGNYVQAGLGAASTVGQLATGESGEFFGNALSGAADFVGGLF